MIHANHRLNELFRRYLNDEATAAELQELVMLLQNTPGNELVNEPARELWNQLQHDKQEYAVDWNAMYAAITSKELQAPVMPVIKRKSFFSNRWMMGASVAAILLLSAGIYFLNNNKTTEKPIAGLQSKYGSDVAPGGNKAMLLLADGSSITLDSANNGLLAHQGNSRIEKPANGQLVYNAGMENATSALAYNTLITPRGGQYQVVLPDGTKVWLNAASELKYPTAFNGKAREVELKGEAYFEVTKNVAQPFMVHVKGMDVQVLGTHFNINAYDDEATMRTALLEGSVKVWNSKDASLLTPGYEAIINKNTSATKVKQADMDEVVAWKNNIFSFQNADIPTIMRQLARWYDVDISYEGKVSTEKFVGEVSRNSNVSEVLRILELNKVHFKIEGKKIVVLP